jgi:hypothetical protein
MQSLFTVLCFWFLEVAYMKINTKIENDMHMIWKTAESLSENMSKHAMARHIDTLFDVLTEGPWNVKETRLFLCSCILDH